MAFKIRLPMSVILQNSAKFKGTSVLISTAAVSFWSGYYQQSDIFSCSHTTCFPSDYLQASQQKHLLSKQHYWLLVPLSADSAPILAIDDALATAVETLHLPLDCDVTVARPTGEHALVQEVYRLVTWQSLTLTSHRNLSPDENFSVSPRRDNYRMIVKEG